MWRGNGEVSAGWGIILSIWPERALSCRGYAH
jgi:hypothetical protein